MVGRNNIENDYLTLKYANKSDIWFHVKDFHGSHTILKILKLPSDTSNILDSIPYELLYKAAKIAVEHSKAKNSSNVPVDFCEVKFVKSLMAVSLVWLFIQIIELFMLSSFIYYIMMYFHIVKIF